MTSEQATAGAADTIGPGATGFGVSYAITSVLSALLVVLKESSEAVHDGLAAITGHHWVTHGLLDVIVFVVLGLVLSRMGGGLRMTGGALVSTIVGATILSGLIIAGYFV
jgi:uncharacterized Tic20 family protein